MCAFRHEYNQTLPSLPTANPPPLPTEVEALVSAETKEKAPFLLTNVNTEVIPLLGEMSAAADKRVPVFRMKSVGALYARLRGIVYYLPSSI